MHATTRLLVAVAAEQWGSDVPDGPGSDMSRRVAAGDEALTLVPPGRLAHLDASSDRAGPASLPVRGAGVAGLAVTP